MSARPSLEFVSSGISISDIFLIDTSSKKFIDNSKAYIKLFSHTDIEAKSLRHN